MRKFFGEFKTFALKGSVIDLAVGVIIGGAFSGIVSSFVENIIMPIVGIFVGGIDLSDWTIILPTIYGTKVTWNIGMFLMTVIDFIVTAFVIFLLVKGINRLREKHAKKEESAAQAEPPEDIKLVTEIRDLLKK